MSQTQIVQVLTEILVSTLGIFLSVMAAYLAPQFNDFLVARVGQARADQIEQALDIGVRAAEAALGLGTPTQKKAFATAIVQSYLTTHNLGLDAGTLSNRIEGALLAAKMAGMETVSKARTVVPLPTPAVDSAAAVPA